MVFYNCHREDEDEPYEEKRKVRDVLVTELVQRLPISELGTLCALLDMKTLVGPVDSEHTGLPLEIGLPGVGERWQTADLNGLAVPAMFEAQGHVARYSQVEESPSKRARQGETGLADGDTSTGEEGSSSLPRKALNVLAGKGPGEAEASTSMLAHVKSFIEEKEPTRGTQDDTGCQFVEFLVDRSADDDESTSFSVLPLEIRDRLSCELDAVLRAEGVVLATGVSGMVPPSVFLRLSSMYNAILSGRRTFQKGQSIFVVDFLCVHLFAAE